MGPRNEYGDYDTVHYLRVLPDEAQHDDVIKQALQDTMSHSNCRHDYDCCGCPSHRATADSLGNGFWRVFVSTTLRLRKDGTLNEESLKSAIRGFASDKHIDHCRESIVDVNIKALEAKAALPDDWREYVSATAVTDSYKVHGRDFGTLDEYTNAVNLPALIAAMKAYKAATEGLKK